MLDRSRIEDRFSEIRRRLDVLQETAETVDNTKFLTDSMISDATERRLQVAIQACIDIASHLVAEMALDKPQKENKQLFLILAKHKIIGQDLGKKLYDMVGMRNVLVHDYTEVQRDKVYHAIAHELGDIEEFVSQIQRFLDKLEKNPAKKSY